MPRQKPLIKMAIKVSPTAFDAMCKAHAFCPSELGHLDRMRWMGSFMETALSGGKPFMPKEFELQTVGGHGKPWDEASAELVAQASGFAGKDWSMGPEELAHVLNTAMNTPGDTPA